MCGIVGIAGLPTSPELTNECIAEKMAATLQHRGPDDTGSWMSSDGFVGLGFRRLAILDLTLTGRQPMESASGKLVMAFNGEIYNHSQIRGELLAVTQCLRFRGTSDTEVLLEAIEHWGCREALARCRGMFALAVWNRERRILTLARDRLGEKPLYYGQIGSAFAFASELKAFRVIPGWKGEVDRASLDAYLRFQYVPSPWTIYDDVKKLPPASMLTYQQGDDFGSAELESYWALPNPRLPGESANRTMTIEDASVQLDLLVRESVSEQMLADVPVGALLSGGIDSSAIVGTMASVAAGTPIKTFTIGFAEADFSEAPHARAIAQFLGTDHTELTLTPNDALQVIPSLPGIFDEPFADASALPTVLIYKLASESVGVTLSGDGGDELFGGYSRYRYAASLSRLVGLAPEALRRAIAGLLTSISVQSWQSTAGLATRVLPDLRADRMGEWVHRTAALLRANHEADLYRLAVTDWGRAPVLVEGNARLPEIDGIRYTSDQGSFQQWMMSVDLTTYLPDNILVKADRTSMYNSLEARSPLLDHRIVEFAQQLPVEWKISNGESKRILKLMLAKHVPQSLTERPKQGFVVPIAAWLRGPLREWAEDLLCERRLRDEGFLDPVSVRETWSEHLSGRRDWNRQLWGILMFQAWLEAERLHTRSA
jgi:asparagine synthase (glutamine-hydrolysing)